MADFLSFLNIQMYGNSVYNILIAALIILAGFATAHLIGKSIQLIIKPFTKKTKTDLDDLIIKIIETPIGFLIILFSIYYAKSILVLSTELNRIFDKGYNIVILVMAVIIGIQFVDIVLYKILTKLASKTESEYDDHLVPIIRQSVKIILFTVSTLMIIDNFGFDITSIVAGLGIGGLALALAAKDMLSNLFGGVSVFLDRAFKPGEYIKTNGVEGTVLEIGLRTTKIKTLDNRIITIPNSKIADNIVENVTSENARKITLNLGLTYDTPVKKIEEAVKIVKEIIKENKVVNKECDIAFNKFGDFSLNIVVTYWINDKNQLLSTQHEINIEIKKRFEKANIDFAFPTQTVIIEKSKIKRK